MQRIPGKGWGQVFRLYGPLQPWFDKTWRPGRVSGLNRSNQDPRETKLVDCREETVTS